MGLATFLRVSNGSQGNVPDRVCSKAGVSLEYERQVVDDLWLKSVHERQDCV